MRNEKLKIYWILAGAVLFNWVFWNEKMAINTVLYGLFLLGVIFSLYPNARHSSTVRWLLAGHLLCLAMIVIHNTMLSKVAYGITLLLMVAFVQYVHRSVLFAGGSVLQNILFAVPGFFEIIKRPGKERSGRFSLGKTIRFGFFPMLLLLLFFILYSLGNNAFSDLIGNWIDSIARYLSDFIEFFSWGRLFFFIAGLLITTALLLRSKLNYFSNKETGYKDELIRSRKKTTERRKDILYDIMDGVMGKFATGIMALKNMNTVGLISLVLLNLLLLVINTIDISYLWIGFDPKGVHLYKMTHQGSDMLIFSILMAMLVILLFFRGNLNFYKSNKYLKWAAYAWIAQNILLAISVLLRDYYYIREAGLARNRIGILFYLALVLFGLISVFWKIYKHKTNYYLFRVNAWAAIVLLIGASTVNWDELIVKYNFSRKDNIILPVTYMVKLSPKVLPILDANRKELERHEALMKREGFWDEADCDGCWGEDLTRRIEKYKVAQRSYSWLSWNKTDDGVRKYFKIAYHNTAIDVK